MLLSVDERRKLFGPFYKIEEREEFSEIIVRNSRTAIKKTMVKFQNERILVMCGEEKNEILSEYIKEFDKLSCERILPVLKNVCRLTAQKYNIKIPFADFYIVSNPDYAVKIAEQLRGISRIFTVISKEEPQSAIYDELYFKHGILIRQLPEFNNIIPDDIVILRYDAGEFPFWKKAPVIDMSLNPTDYKMTVDIRNVCVDGNEMEQIKKIRNGKIPIMMYELIDKYPKADEKIFLNEKAEKIFLLDTERI